MFSFGSLGGSDMALVKDAEILTVGDELLTGLVADTNAAWLGEQLSSLGWRVARMTTVGDNEEELVRSLDQAVQRASAVVVTGGLGPTPDDITRSAAARHLGVPLKFDPDTYTRIERYFERLGRPKTESNRLQAMAPESARILPNTNGLAPGFAWMEEKCLVFVLPGVPPEMKAMFENGVKPVLEKEGGGVMFRSRRLLTFGFAESELVPLLEFLGGTFPDVRVAYLPGKTGVVVRVSTFGADSESADRMLDRVEKDIRGRLGSKVVSSDGRTMEQVVAELLLSERKTLALAESCTGGLVAHKLTNVPGSSGFLDRGLVVYSNRAKVDLLGISPDLLELHGAVSPETAKAMAEGVRERAGTDIGLAITGIAGPGGGTETKPVGLVHIGYSDQNRTIVETHRFARERQWNKERSALSALDLVRRVLLKVEG